MALPLSPTHHAVPQFDLSALLKAKMSRPESPNSNSDKTARSSFSSVRENDDGLAQTFTRSKISSYTQGPEESASWLLVPRGQLSRMEADPHQGQIRQPQLRGSSQAIHDMELSSTSRRH